MPTGLYRVIYNLYALTFTGHNNQDFRRFPQWYNGTDVRELLSSSQTSPYFLARQLKPQHDAAAEVEMIKEKVRALVDWSNGNLKC